MRGLLCGVILLVFASGFWGAVSVARATREARRAALLRGAYDDVRYAAAVELSAERSSLPGTRRAQSRSEFFRGSRLSALALERARANASSFDLSRIGRLSNLQRAGVERGARLFAAAADGDTDEALALERDVDRTLRSLEQGAERAGSDFRLRNAGRWPATMIDYVDLVGMLIVWALGLSFTALGLVQLVGYPRRREDARLRALRALERAALTDNLTGLRDHGAFQEDLKREIVRRNRTGSCFRRPSSRKRLGGCSTITSAGTGGATRTGSPLTRSRSSRGSSSWPTRSRRSRPTGRTARAARPRRRSTS